MCPAPLAPTGASRQQASRRKPQARAVGLSRRPPSRRADRVLIHSVPRGFSAREDRDGKTSLLARQPIGSSLGWS
jgi:hypothetical protein